jgi:hypothetical protein
MPRPRYVGQARAVLEPPLPGRGRDFCVLRGCVRCLLRVLCACLLCALSVSACAPSPPSFPSGSGAPFAGFEAAYAEAVAECRSAHSVLAELGLSGRAGRDKLRGRINAGIAAPRDIRLEGVAFGRPIFILAGHDGQATLLLTREDRVVRNEPPAAIVQAWRGAHARRSRRRRRRMRSRCRYSVERADIQR